ncbi:B3 domain-containing transcription factor VRN1-like [Papaver somniferum]|uniref:B3 domain-containing transcription factor VRN1-like n=1 Tax=Papaver somniferum TaxID=3469 RepID=UPI000E6FEFBD|nr:B3 domain-containing transcription factor VRN1-like [Papaver somniferum]
MHFFEIFHTSIITDKRLELPKEFTVKYGKKLCDNVIIKVPNGVWRIGMRKAEGLILFENGWPEFMEFYSIRVGHVILFRYDGNSKFQVHIFGMDATEIDYPSHNDSTNHDAEMTSTHSDEVEVVSIHSDTTQSDDEPSMSSESPLNPKAEPAKQEFPQKSRKQRKAIPTTFRNKALQATVEAVEGFKSENPFFKVTIHVSYIKGPLRVPNVFANSSLRNITQRGITLRISDGRTWKNWR